MEGISIIYNLFEFINIEESITQLIKSSNDELKKYYNSIDFYYVLSHLFFDVISAIKI